VLVSLGPEAVEPLIAVLRDDFRGVRKAAVKAMRDIGDPREFEPTVALLSDNDDSIRCAAAEALEGLGERCYSRACVNSKKWLIRSKHTRRSRTTAEREVKQMA
jgi:HEAT repeat protein